MLPAITAEGRRALPWLALLGVGGLLVWRFVPIEAWVEAFARFVVGWGAWAPVLYAAAYAVAAVLGLPGAPFSVGAGLVWGMAGLPIPLAGATVGACLCYLLSRHLLYHRVRPLVRARPLLAALDRAVGEEGWRIVLLLRLNPLVPFNVQNYTFGVTRVRFWPYAAATAVGIVPNTALHVYFGVLGRDAAGAGVWRWGVLAAGLIMTAVASVIVGRKVQRVLATPS